MELVSNVEKLFIQKHLLSNGHNGLRIPELCITLGVSLNIIIPIIKQMISDKKLRVSKSLKADLYYIVIGFSNPELLNQEIKNFKNLKNELNLLHQNNSSIR